MPVFKNNDNGTWYVMAWYTNWKGERKQKCKRGFSTKREAQEWERIFKMQSAGDMDMTFEAFTELYENRTEGFGNGRAVRNKFESAVTKQAVRLSDSRDLSDSALVTIEAEDVL